MRCKTCDYALWNLPPEAKRACPECGAPFKPSDFTFALNSVQFRCPHCLQAYYGTSEKGHLVPFEFDCVQCGRHISMDDCLLTPAAGVPEVQTRPDIHPWLERARIGRWKAYWQTTGRSFTAPGALMRATPQDSPVGAAWLYLIINLSLPFLVGMAPFGLVFVGLIFAGPGAGGVGGGGGGGGGGGTAALITGLVGMTIGTLISLVAAVVLWALSAHLLLHLTGPKGDLKRTVEALCYSSGPNVLYGIPLLGCYIGSSVSAIWWTVGACIAIKEAHRVSAGRAALAGLVFPVLTVVLSVGLYAFFIFSTMSAAQRASAAATAAAQSSAAIAADYAAMSKMGGALRTLALGGGKGPGHAVEVIIAGTLSPSDFIGAQSYTNAEEVPIGDITLAAVPFLDERQERVLIELARQALPPDTVAYRLGDVVFTYPGIDFNAPESGPLWTAVRTLDPDANAANPLAAQQSIVIVRADGTTHSFLIVDAPVELEAQNRLRAERGLAPLPDLRTLRHHAPARGTRAPPPPDPDAPKDGGD